MAPARDPASILVRWGKAPTSPGAGPNERTGNGARGAVGAQGRIRRMLSVRARRGGRTAVEQERDKNWMNEQIEPGGPGALT